MSDKYSHLSEKAAQEMLEIDLEEKIAKAALRRMEESVYDLKGEIWGYTKRRMDVLHEDIRRDIETHRSKVTARGK